MNVSKTVLEDGDGPTPNVGDRVSIQHTSYLKDIKKPENKGEEFESTNGHSDLNFTVGSGKIIKDEGIMTMAIGEKATFDIPSDYAFGKSGWPGVVPPGADLIIDVELTKNDGQLQQVTVLLALLASAQDEVKHLRE